MKGSNELADFSGAGAAGDLERPSRAPGWRACSPRPEGGEDRGGAPFFQSHTPLPQSRVIGLPSAGSVPPAYVFMKHGPPARGMLGSHTDGGF